MWEWIWFVIFLAHSSLHADASFYLTCQHWSTSCSRLILGHLFYILIFNALQFGVCVCIIHLVYNRKGTSAVWINVCDCRTQDLFQHHQRAETEPVWSVCFHGKLVFFFFFLFHLFFFFFFFFFFFYVCVIFNVWNILCVCPYFLNAATPQ